MKKTFLLALLSATVAFGESNSSRTNALPADPDKVWAEIEQAKKAPPQPAEWASKAPTEEQRKEWQQQLGARSAEVALKARQFYTQFPDNAKADEAKALEKYFNEQALRFGNEEVAARIEGNLNEDQRVQRKLNDVQRRAMAKRDEGVPAVLKEFEAGLRQVMKQYPTNAQPWDAMMVIANNGDKETQKRVLAEIIDTKVASEETISRAKGLLKAIGALGRPLELSYTSVDGRKVDVQKLKGKVVLVDFWATWCPPCMAALPEVVETYNKLHDQGFEIVGISLDKSKDALQQVVERNKMPWPQFFDGQGWGNKFVIEYGISEVPTMWLVDKAGKLRTMEARENLEQQIKDLLAETL